MTATNKAQTEEVTDTDRGNPEDGRMYRDEHSLSYWFSPNQWQLVLVELVRDGFKPTRDRVAHRLTDLYPQLNPEGDRNTPIRLDFDGEQIEQLEDAVRHAGMDPYREDSDPTPEPAEPKAPVSPRRKAARKAGKPCACGCGGMTAGGTWLPGHDSRHKSRLIDRVDQSADRYAADEMVQRGWWKRNLADDRLKKAQASQGDEG